MRITLAIVFCLISSIGFSQENEFSELTLKGNNVFIEAPDEASVTHATNALEFWGYWTIVKDKTKANFILKFTYKNQAFGDKKGYATFLSIDNKELKKTKTVNTGMSMDFNTKRAVITKLVSKRIQPMFETE
ncbi:hypothetical protein [Carboxylicivirga sp. N1Y90]|uniref:hypothetical protein n=1 Tax=Carboxylicivirga fragile TaxID=3417571 RepID=UPI003D3248E0|nr:hypothetical protein [Marinilabiliaceae bacterium N1Y90]